MQCQSSWGKFPQASKVLFNFICKSVRPVRSSCHAISFSSKRCVSCASGAGWRFTFFLAALIVWNYLNWGEHPEIVRLLAQQHILCSCCPIMNCETCDSIARYSLADCPVSRITVNALWCLTWFEEDASLCRARLEKQRLVQEQESNFQPGMQDHQPKAAQI